MQMPCPGRGTKILICSLDDLFHQLSAWSFAENRVPEERKGFIKKRCKPQLSQVEALCRQRISGTGRRKGTILFGERGLVTGTEP